MKDNFEHIIKSKLENHSIQAPEDAWENISAGLSAQKKKRVLWWAQWLRIAAVLIPIVMMIGFGFYFYKENNTDFDNNTENTTKISYETVTQPSSGTTSVDLENHTSEPNIQNQLSPINYTSTTFPKTNANTEKIPFRNTAAIISTAINAYVNLEKTNSQNIDFKPNNSTPLISYLTQFYTPDSKENLVSKPEESSHTNDFTEEIEIQDRWSLSPYFGLGMLESANQSSLLADELNQFESKNEIATSYGAKASYQINPRLKVRSGLAVLSFTQNTYNVPVSLNSRSGEVSYNVKNSSNLGINLENNTETATATETNVSNMKEDLSQTIQFYEIPAEIEYQITRNSKLNLSATTGISTLVLSKNKIYITGEQETVLGEPTNVQELSFTANAGAKVDYKISDKLSINVEPQLKYMLNPVTNNDEVQPYVLGVNTGLTYQF